MLFESYRDNVVYNSQSRITFPRKGNGMRDGEGVMTMLMTPNRNRGLMALQDPVLSFIPSLTKRLITDSVYREKIGTSRILSLERAQTDRYYINAKDLKLTYVPASSRGSVLNQKRNVVNDLSRWMEIIFARMDNLSAKKKCSEFLRILSNIINNSDYRGYTKLLLFDLNSWTASIKSCVLMNRDLLNNPLSIFFFAANYYPELMDQFPNVRLMIVNRASGQVFLINTRDITRKNYSKIKAKLSMFKSLVFSIEDEYNPTEDSLQEEVKAQMINSYKEELKRKLKFNLMGGDPESDPFAGIDITDATSVPIDDDIKDLQNELNELQSEEDSETTESEPENVEIISTEMNSDEEETFSMNEEISRAVDDAVEEIEDLTDLEEIDVDEVAYNIAEQIKDRKYKSSFMPNRSKEELARIERLTQKQEEAIPPSVDEVQRKTIKTSITGGYVNTTNPNILTSKFKNFDKDYVENCMEYDIDEAVKALSNASQKIFVTKKEVTDSSTPQDLKSTYTYYLEDEKGNKWKMSFDIPRIIDNNYVYLNGSKKSIRHQFILKPIVKTGPDVVQLVTFYNKVFIYRRGIVNQNVNRIVTYLQKNPDRFKIQAGNSSMKNDEYDVPLDLAMFSRYFSSFTIGSYTFYTSIDSLLVRYKKLKREDLNFDKTVQLPIAINPRSKEVLFLNLKDDSYTDILYNLFPEEDKNAIRKIKRKPKLVTASAKMMKRELPLILFMLYCEGFASVMKKANIEYEFVDKKSKKNYDPMVWDSIELSDGFIVWKKSPFRNEILMNGLKAEDLTDFSYEDLESKDTYISLILPKYPGNGKIYFALDNYRDFLLDNKTKEILQDLGYPTDLVSLLVVAAGMLTDTHYIIENNLNNLRVRSNEVIAQLVYTAVTKAYTEYRSTSTKKRPTSVTVRKSAIIDALLGEDTNMIEEYSSLNPVLELDKTRSVTFKGVRGIQMARAMTLPRRAYDKSMPGTVAMSTSPERSGGYTAMYSSNVSLIAGNSH